jgi:RND family efflux transporter MFP subunit
MSTKRSGRAAKITAVALGVGLFAFIGVRVKETLGNRQALAAGLAATQTKDGPKRTAAALVLPRAISWRPSIPLTGTLSPIQDADVGFKMGGRIVAVRAKVGDRVKAGQALASLDVAEAAAQSATAAAGVRAAEVALEMAKDGERRLVALFDGGAISDSDHTGAKNRTALAAAQLEQARAQARLASVGVGNGSLSAPFSGLITRTPNGIGKIVGPGEALFRVEDVSVLKLTATLSETDARLIENGDAIVIEGSPAAGKVVAVLGSLDAQTRRVPLLAEIPNDGAPPLLAGSFVRATITAGREVQALSLPASVIRPGSQDEVVVAIGGKAHLARVVFTTAADGSLVVRSGITATDTLVERPSSEVHEGDDLGTAQAPAAPAPR